MNNQLRSPIKHSRHKSILVYLKKRRTLHAVTVIIVLVLLTWVTHPKWMPLLYRYLDTGQQPLVTDLIIIPGGNSYRAVIAAQLYKDQYAPKILISGSREDVERTHKILMELNIKENDISIISGATSTWSEAQANLQYLRDSGFRSVLIVTDTPHTRRLRAVYASLNFTGINIIVISSPLGNENTWWRDLPVRDFIFREYLKMLFYFLRYDVWSWS